MQPRAAAPSASMRRAAGRLTARGPPTAGSDDAETRGARGRVTATAGVAAAVAVADAEVALAALGDRQRTQDARKGPGLGGGGAGDGVHGVASGGVCLSVLVM